MLVGTILLAILLPGHSALFVGRTGVRNRRGPPMSTCQIRDTYYHLLLIGATLTVTEVPETLHCIQHHDRSHCSHTNTDYSMFIGNEQLRNIARRSGVHVSGLLTSCWVTIQMTAWWAGWMSTRSDERTGRSGLTSVDPDGYTRPCGGASHSCPARDLLMSPSCHPHVILMSSSGPPFSASKSVTAD